MKPKKPDSVAVHVQQGPMHGVIITNIRVLVLNNDGSWFAQGLEVDYSAQADTLEGVKKSFQEGLTKTIEAHLLDYTGIQNVLRVAPQSYWDHFWKHHSKWVFTYGSVHLIREPELGGDLRLEFLQPPSVDSEDSCREPMLT